MNVISIGKFARCWNLFLITSHFVYIEAQNEWNREDTLEDSKGRYSMFIDYKMILPNK